MGPWSGTVVFDERAFGTSFAGQTIRFWADSNCLATGFGCDLTLTGVLSWTLGIGLFTPYAGTDVFLTFDRTRQIVDYDIIDDLDPTVARISPSGDSYDCVGYPGGPHSYDCFYFAPPGTWELTSVTEAPIPLPAGVWLLAGGIA